jgi:eukaryotic-like serine/threonine-protein kinase
MRIPKELRWQPTGHTLGRGGQASVVEVIDRTSPEAPPYALKALAEGRPTTAYERFYREVEAIRRLSHPSIVSIVDHSQPDASFHYYVMRYRPDASSLKRHVTAGTCPFVGDSLSAVLFFRTLADAVAAWTAVGVVHRDLSPANVLLLPDLSIQVIDFGLCQILDGETLTLSDEGVGTPNYMAPECESGAEEQIGVGADLYSAGKLLWTAITGNVAFAREEPVTASKAMNRMLPNASGAWHLQEVFARTIRRSPLQRYRTAAEALRHGEEIMNVIQSGALPIEKIAEGVCPLCRLGKLEGFSGSHMVFGNPNPAGIVSLQCGRCGYCFAWNRQRAQQTIRDREE